MVAMIAAGKEIGRNSRCGFCNLYGILGALVFGDFGAQQFAVKRL